MKITVRAPVNPTESKERVKKAILNLFDLKVEELPEGKLWILLGKGKGKNALERFQDLLRRQFIRGSAREVLLKSKREDFIEFYLNKQAAFMGVVNFSKPGGSSVGGLGTIKVEIRGNEDLIDWLSQENDINIG